MKLTMDNNGQSEIDKLIEIERDIGRNEARGEGLKALKFHEIKRKSIYERLSQSTMDSETLENLRQYTKGKENVSVLELMRLGL